MQAFFPPRTLDPFAVKPVLRPLGIAVEPQPASRDGASRAGLLDEGARHQHHLVHQNSRERDALDQPRRAFVSAAEHIKAVFAAREAHPQQMFRIALRDLHPEHFEPRRQLLQNVPPQASHRLAAQPELPPVKAAHRPQEKAQSHAERLSRPHRAVADDRLAVSVRAARHPPRHSPQLLGGKPVKLHLPCPSAALRGSAPPARHPDPPCPPAVRAPCCGP